MKPIYASAVLLALSGCAAPEPGSYDATESEEAAATRAFLESNNLEPVGWINVRGSLQVLGSNEWFAEIQTDDGRFLVETDRPCQSLTERGNDDSIEYFNRQASSGGLVRRLVPHVDYIRNCKIAAIYDLNSLGAGTDDAESEPGNR